MWAVQQWRRAACVLRRSAFSMPVRQAVRMLVVSCLLFMIAYDNLLLYLLLCLLLMAAACCSRPQPPLYYLRVRNFAESTTPNLMERLNNIDGAGELQIKNNNEGQNPYAIVKFKDAQSAYKAVRLMNGEILNGEKIEVSLLVDLEYPIGDNNNNRYREFIDRLRDLLAKREDGSSPEYIDGDRGKVLGVQRSGDQPERWIHIKLIAKEEGTQEVSTTTLVIRDDNLYVKGFTGKGGQWFELWEKNEPGGEKLPKEYYSAEKLWRYSYPNLMKLNDNDQVKATLMSTKLGKDFAERAVRRLSRYSPGDVENDVDIPVRLGLAGLLVMISESARFNPILDHIADSDNWKDGKGLQLQGGEDELLITSLDLIWNWGNMSAALREWKDSREWDDRCGAKFGVASRCVHLVLRTPRDIDPSNKDKAHMEILGVSASFRVPELRSIGEKKGAKAMVIKVVEVDQEAGNKKLGVLVPDGIRRYAWFDIEVPLSGGDSIKTRCDCRKEEGVEYQRLTREIVPSSGAGDDMIQLTYLVMSNAVKATVEIKLRTSDGGNYAAHGMIYAYISDINADDHPIVLFFKSDKKYKKFESSTLPLKLDRTTAAVWLPQGKKLQIELGKLRIKRGKVDEELRIRREEFEDLELDMDMMYIEGQHLSSNTVTEARNVDSRISFDIKDSGAIIIPFNGNNRDKALEVKVIWTGIPNKVMKTHVACENIADKEMFTRCIADLRGEIANGCQGVLKDYIGEVPPEWPNCTKDSHQVLTRWPQGWIRVQLDDGESATTTLAIGYDTCYGVGFQNQSGVWYELGVSRDPSPSGGGKSKTLPAEYNSVLLGWGRPGGVSYQPTILGIDGWGRGVSYQDILGVGSWDAVVEELDPAKLGRDFATKAVGILSRYPDVEEDEDARKALAGIILMVCESAKLNNTSLHEYFVGTGTPSFSWEQVMNHVKKWGEISRALLYWRDHGYYIDYGDHWGKHMQQKMKGTTSSCIESLGSPKDALDIVHLVFNYCPRQIDMEYEIGDEAEKFKAFIKLLRRKLAKHERAWAVDFPTGDSRPVLGRFRGEQPARWFHIKLQLPGKETSTTLAVRDDTVFVRGFSNQDGKWFDLGYAGGTSTILPQEYKATLLSWGFGFADILGVPNWDDVVDKLDDEGLGQDFATKAVSVLARYKGPDVLQIQEEEEGDFPAPRVALVGLALMVSGSARFYTLEKHFAGVWNKRNSEDRRLSEGVKELLGRPNSWVRISRALLRWKNRDCSDSEWNAPQDPNISWIKSGKEALSAVALLFDSKLYWHPPAPAAVSRPSPSSSNPGISAPSSTPP